MNRRFCMVTTFYPPFNFGGDGVYVRRLANALARRGHEVHVVHDIDAYRQMAGVEPDVAYDDHAGVEHHGISRGGLWRLDLVASHQIGRPVATRGRLRDLLDQGGFDVTHFHNVSLVGGPGVLRLGGGVKLCTLHDYWFVCPMHTLWRLDREACRRRTCLRCTLHGRRPPQLWRRAGAIGRSTRHLDAFIAPSDFSRRTHLDNGLAARIVELPNFAPAPSTGGAAAAPPPREAELPVGATSPQAPRRPFFLCVARLERLKGVQDVIEVFRGFDRADLLIAGQGGMEEELRRQARGLSHVRFLGWQSHEALERLYGDTLAVLIPSLCYEAAFPLVGIEAFSAAAPVIARRIGALEQLEQMGGGWLFGDAAQLEGVLCEALDDEEARLVRGREARRLFEERFSEEVHLERYLSLVAEIESRREAS